MKCFEPKLWKLSLWGLLTLLLLANAPSPAFAQATEPFLGQLALVPYNFAPTGWMLCQGQILSISQNTALFALLGTTFGGNGTTTFALPDLRGRVPVGWGQGPGLQNYDLGQQAGTETHTLTYNEMPIHNHLIQVDTAVATTDRPASGMLSRNAAGIPQYGTATTGNLSAAAVSNAGGSQPHSIMQPYLTLNWIIAIQGVFPSRSVPSQEGADKK